MSLDSLSVRRNDGPSSYQRGEAEIVELEAQGSERGGCAPSLTRSSPGNRPSTDLKGSKEGLAVSAVPVLMAKDHSSPAAAQETTLRRHAHSFLSTEMAGCRREYFKIVLRAAFLIIVLTWACLPIYWGSLASSAARTGNLSVWVVDRDQARIGIGLTNTVQAAAARANGPGSLGWQVVDADDAGDDAAVVQAVLNEDVWMAVVVSENATLHLQNARARGDASYDPASAITVYYAQARNEVVASTFLVPLATSFLSNYTASYASASVARFIAAISSADGSVNATALQLIAQAPQTLSPAIGFAMVNLRPYTAPVAQAVTLVGQIYIVIFAFIFVMAHSTARTFVEPFLTYRSYIRVRIFVPLGVYLPLSLSYAMVSLPFKLPFDAKFSYAAGFFAFAAFIYMGMCALGLALEAMITLLTPRFVPFFLVLLIIVNISTAALPTELQHPFYQYGAGFQFLHIETAVRTIVFNTASRLGTDAGVLLFWAVLSAGTMALFTWWVRRRDRRRGRGRGWVRERERGRRGAKAKDMEKFEAEVPYGRTGRENGKEGKEGKGCKEGKGKEGDFGFGDVDQGEKRGREKGKKAGGGECEHERSWDRDRDRDCDRDRADAAGREEMGNDDKYEDDQDEEGDEEDVWKRANVDLGLAPVESRASRRSGAEVIAFQA